MARTRRSAAERLADLQAKAAKVEAEAAMQAARENPVLAPFIEDLESVQTDLMLFRRGFCKGPQNFEARRIAKQVWIDEINAFEALAREQVKNPLRS